MRKLCYKMLLLHLKYCNFVMLLLLVPRANTQVNSNATKLPQSDALEPECGNTQKMVDTCFMDFPPHLMQFLQPRLVENELDIAAKCTVFNKGMECFDSYTSRCLPGVKKDMFENNVEGARKFFIKFCTDMEFQKDYMRHKDCFSHIQQDWIECTKVFQNILTDELHSKRQNMTNKFLEFCCARHAYENCIYNSARYKCYKNSAAFARDTAQMLSDEKHFSNCRQYEQTICNASYSHQLRPAPQRVAMLLIILLLPLCWQVSANKLAGFN